MDKYDELLRKAHPRPEYNAVGIVPKAEQPGLINRVSGWLKWFYKANKKGV